MPLPSFSVRLQHGIKGGFAPPTPNAIHTIDLDTNDLSALSAEQHHVLRVNSHIRQDGTADIQGGHPKTLTIPHGSDDENAIHELHALLKDLPTEFPPGAEDIYGLDTSIAWGSENLRWQNGGPEGCGSGQSAVKADDDHKVKFKRAVEIVNGLVNKAK
ncbi:hypothetical protein APHAL10511_007203 [Amanita phalloides]|nr:hypothetical protein APHAL10511_007203 [Amanita phalloides]